MSDEKSANRLPPPAFPPGARKRVVHRSPTPDVPKGGEGYISPDDPMPTRQDSMGGALISPDEPIPERDHSMDSAFISPDDPMPYHAPVEGHGFEDDGEDGVVTGMDFDAHVEVEDLMAAADPFLTELTHKISKLAEGLRGRGEAGLRITPEMDRFESTLRGYCVGYLAGRRAEDDRKSDY